MPMSQVIRNPNVMQNTVKYPSPIKGKDWPRHAEFIAIQFKSARSTRFADP
jgi:hypothetical protein